MVLCPVDMSHVPPSLYLIIFSHLFVQWHIFHKKISGQRETRFCLGKSCFHWEILRQRNSVFFQQWEISRETEMARLRVSVVDCAPRATVQTHHHRTTMPPPSMQLYTDDLPCTYRSYHDPSHIKPTYYKCQMYRDVPACKTLRGQWTGSETLPCYTKCMIAGKTSSKLR